MQEKLDIASPHCRAEAQGAKAGGGVAIHVSEAHIASHLHFGVGSPQALKQRLRDDANGKVSPWCAGNRFCEQVFGVGVA